VISTLRSFYLETVINICPVFAFCNDEELSQLTDKSRWVTFKADEMMAEQDKEGTLYVIMTGVAQVILKHGDKAISLGYISSGDLVGEMVPSPVTVITTCTVLAIAIDRRQMLQLPEVAQAEIKKRFAKAQKALQEVIAGS
jgi:CRP-like cAMP-binding protein